MPYVSSAPSTPRIGGRLRVLLPCNVTVESVAERRTMVRLTNPEALLATASLGASPELGRVARDASERMARATDTLKAPDVSPTHHAHMW
jgi:hypothetical protein